MPKFQRNSFVNYSDTPQLFFFPSKIIYNPQKCLQQFDEWYKQKVTETQFSKGLPESEFSLLPFQVTHYLVYFKKH